MALATIIAEKTKFRAISKQKRKHQKVISFLWKENKHFTDPCLVEYFNIPGYWDFSWFLINKPQCLLKYFMIYLPALFRWIKNYTYLVYVISSWFSRQVWNWTEVPKSFWMKRMFSSKWYNGKFLWWVASMKKYTELF